MNKIIRDTLMNPKTGQWSRKNLACVTSLFYAMWYAGYGLVIGKDVQEFVIWGFLGLSGGLLGLSSWEKKNLNVNTTVKPEDNADLS